MAVEQTQVLPAPVLEGALTAFTKKLTPLIGQQIDTTKFDPKVAAQTQLQKDASAAAAGLGSLVGPQAFQPFMSPYQQEVIDTTLAEFDRQQAIASARRDAIRYAMEVSGFEEDEIIETFNELGLKEGGIVSLAEGGMLDFGGKEMDLRKGGFVPIGKKEKADDVPARLSKNEFVMTADAVRAAGGGSVNKGAQRMYDLMNNLEARA